MSDLLKQVTESIQREVKPRYGFAGSMVMLNDVLAWIEKSGFKYCHFAGHEFEIYNGEEPESIAWELSSPYLSDQKGYLIEFLFEDILPCFEKEGRALLESINTKQ